MAHRGGPSVQLPQTISVRSPGRNTSTEWLPNGIGDDFQTIQDPLDTVDATAVRKFLRSAQLEQDIVEAIMSQGGLTKKTFPFQVS